MPLEQLVEKAPFFPDAFQRRNHVGLLAQCQNAACTRQFDASASAVVVLPMRRKMGFRGDREAHYLEGVASIVINITREEIRTGNPDRLTLMYTIKSIPLARLIEDSISIRLPGEDTAAEIRERFSFCGFATIWPLLPWVAFLGDGHYARLVRGAVSDFRLVEQKGHVRHVPEKKRYETLVQEQVDSLDELVETRRISKRAWRTRRNNVLQYLLGEG